MLLLLLLASVCAIIAWCSVFLVGKNRLAVNFRFVVGALAVAGSVGAYFSGPEKLLKHPALFLLYALPSFLSLWAAISAVMITSRLHSRAQWLVSALLLLAALRFDQRFHIRARTSSGEPDVPGSVNLYYHGGYFGPSEAWVTGPLGTDGTFYVGFCRSLILHRADSVQCHAKGWDRKWPAVFVSNRK